MPRRSSPFTETDIRRAVRAVRAAGLEVTGVEIDRAHNRIIVITDKDRVPISGPDMKNVTSEQLLKLI